MDQSIAAFKNGLTKIRTGRANPGILDTIQVDYYGSTVPLSQVANVTHRLTHHQRSALGKKHVGQD
jgi:ribosome recycling factor